MRKSIIIMAAVVGLSVAAPLWAMDTMMDDRIASSFRKTHVYEQYLKHDDINVDVKDGNVTLSGYISDEAHRTLAKEAAAGLPGVKSVKDELKVRDYEQSGLAETWTAIKIKSLLLFHKNVDAYGTEVTVSNGVVTLRGEAESVAQKELTAEYARDVDGVKEVRNEMTISSKSPMEPTKVSTNGFGKKMRESVSDTAITAQVKMALLIHSSTSALNTEVDTQNGVVIVRGKAKDEAEKALVTKLVNRINGVKEVKNEMTVEQPTN